MKNLKILTILVAVAMVAALFAGCKEEPPRVTIEIMTWHGPDAATNYYDGYLEIAQSYMAEHKDIKVVIKYEADETYGSILETGFAGGTASDIIQMKSAQRSTYAQNLLDLREYLNKVNPYDVREPKWIDNFVGGESTFPVTDNGVNPNSILFIPNDGNPEVFAGSLYIYNKAIVADAGLDPDVTPVTWEDMFTWLDAISKVDGVEPIAGSSDLGGKVSQIGYQFGSNYQDKFFAEQYNTEEFTNDFFWDKLYILTCYEGGETMALDSLPYYPAMFKLIQKHMDFLQDSWIENSYETETLSFISGNTAMMNTSFWSFDTLVSSLSETTFPDGYGLFPIPYMDVESLDYAVGKGWITQEDADAARPYTINSYLSGGGVGMHEYGFTVNDKVAEDPEKLATVIDFLNYMSSVQVQKKYVVTANTMSPVKDVPLVDSLKNFIIEEPEQGFATNVLGYTVVEWGAAGWDIEVVKYLNGEISMEEMISTVSAAEWKGDIPTSEALQAAVDDAKAQLDAAAEEEKEAKQRAYDYALLRQSLINDYYHNMTGNLDELR